VATDPESNPAEFCVFFGPDLQARICEKQDPDSFFSAVAGRDVEAEAKAGSGPFTVEAEARKFYPFRIGYLT